VKKALLIIFPFFFINTYSQESEISQIITDIAEELAADEDNPGSVELFFEQLYELAEDPVNINSGDEKEISRLFFLSDFQVKSLADYVHKSGKILSMYEIPSIPGFDRQTAEWISQFVIPGKKQEVPASPAKLHNTLVTNFILKPGSYDTSYLGSPLKILTKYKFSAGRLSGGITAEKDAGEKIFPAQVPVPDFLSAHISFSGKGFIRKIILGDFGSRLGLGTNINTGMRTSLSLSSPGYMPVRNEIKPWTSADENNFFRGVAAELSTKKFGAILFFSQNMTDATTGTSEDSSELFIENLYTSGLHNKSSLLLKKDVVRNSAYCASLSYEFKSLRTGITCSYNRFSIPFRSETYDPEKLYDLTGYGTSILSASYNYSRKRILLFGEASLEGFSDPGIVQGIGIRASDRLSVNFLYRNYSPGFVSFHGAGPGNSSATNNERGLFGNFSLEAAKHLFVSAGCDISYTPWLKYMTGFPSMAKRYEVRLRYLPDEKYSFDIKYFSRKWMCDLNRDQGIAGISENKVQSVQGISRFLVSDKFSVVTRIDFKFAALSSGKGMLMLQDLKYVFRKVPLTVWFRYCIFRTDDWNSRLYTYENDLLYSFSIPALSGNGTRNYLMLKWDLKDYGELRIKYGMTEIQDNNSAIEGQHEVKMQVRLWF